MDLPQRKQIRLPDYDYSAPGAYFVTACTHEKRCILSTITVGDGVLDVPCVRLSPYGKIVEETLREIVNTYSWLSLDRYVIMPNHIHLILVVDGNSGPSRAPAPTNGNSGPSRAPAPTNAFEGDVSSKTPANAKIPRAIGVMKRLINKEAGENIFQRSYHEHVIRNEADYRRIWDYIDTNPAKWTEDCYYMRGQ